MRCGIKSDLSCRRSQRRGGASSIDRSFARANVLISSRVPVAGLIAVGYRLLTAPFCMGFAGIEAFCAFLAVATHRICQPRQESLFERNAAG